VAAVAAAVVAVVAVVAAAVAVAAVVDPCPVCRAHSAAHSHCDRGIRICHAMKQAVLCPAHPRAAHPAQLCIVCQTHHGLIDHFRGSGSK
jgi:hypothetical protein